jgi:hypothetical protein
MIMKTLFAVILAGFLTAGGAAIEEPEITTLKIGAPAPAFDLPGVDGKNWKLSDFDQAKILVIIFTCNLRPSITKSGSKSWWAITRIKASASWPFRQMILPQCGPMNWATPIWAIRWKR